MVFAKNGHLRCADIFGFHYCGQLWVRHMFCGLVMNYTISHIHLSSEAQCVSYQLPLVDCHIHD